MLRVVILKLNNKGNQKPLYCVNKLMTENDEEIKKATNIETMNIIKGNVMHYFYPFSL